MPEWAAAHSVHYQFLANQQLMLEDLKRTGLYRDGIVGNRRDFEDKVVLDVGAGTGILSLFAAQAGARKVYAIEGTSAAEYAKALVAQSGFADRIEVIRGRLEHIDLPTKVDVIISEPWGFFLFHERMIEAFVQARARFLKPGGRLFPSAAKLWLAPFTDVELYDWRCQKVAFWYNQNFFGVDLSALTDTAYRELFEMPALGEFSPKCLVAEPRGYEFDFLGMRLDDLGTINLPFEFVARQDGPVHGLAGWFDVAFEGSERRVVLSTSPYEPCTHWAQMRFVFRRPVEMRAGQTLRGQLTMRANPQSSYDVTFEGECDGLGRIEPQLFRLQCYYAWESEE
jgi:histone-arginine methyltransferase CARM1